MSSITCKTPHEKGLSTSFRRRCKKGFVSKEVKSKCNFAERGGKVVTVSSEGQVIFTGDSRRVVVLEGVTFSLCCKTVTLSLSPLKNIILSKPLFTSTKSCVLKGLANITMIEPTFEGVELDVTVDSVTDLLQYMSPYLRSILLKVKKGGNVVDSTSVVARDTSVTVCGAMLPVCNEKSGVDDIDDDDEVTYVAIEDGSERVYTKGVELKDRFTVFKLESSLTLSLVALLKRVEITDIVLKDSVVVFEATTICLRRVKVVNSSIILKQCETTMSGVSLCNTTVITRGGSLECSFLFADTPLSSVGTTVSMVFSEVSGVE